MAGKYRPNCCIRQSSAFRTYPKRRAAVFGMDSGAHEFSVFAQIGQQERGDLEFDRGTCFGLGLRDQDYMGSAAELQVANELEGREILASNGSKGSQGEHETVSVLDGVSQPEPRPELRPHLIH